MVTGTRLLHYSILRKIGSGAMSVVYEAFDTKLERKVALKILTISEQVDKKAQTRLAHEAKVISKFDHPNAGVVYSLEEIAGLKFLVMALYEGETLESYLSSNTLSIATVLEFALQIASALAHAHSFGVIHRDIKPANIFVAKDSSDTKKIKVLDFGLAKLEMQSANQSTEKLMVGTILYAAPEQLKGKVSPQSDLWAWGSVVYEMLTHTTPFKDAKATEIVSQILNHEPAPLEQYRKDIPDGLAYVVMKCLEKNPERRIQSAKELIVLLEQCSLEIKSDPQQVPFNQAKTKLVPFLKAKLPVPNNQFIGREPEIKQLIQLLNAPIRQPITVVGLGGMGKSRLVIEVARQVQDKYLHGAVFVDLSSIEDARFLPTTVLHALGIAANKDPHNEMIEMLKFREMLLVFDNFEHIMAGKDIVSQILNVAPEIQIFISSRECLGLHTEVVFELNGFPEPNAMPLANQQSAQLFLSSARRVNRDFVFEASDRADFERIYRLLSGSPLGLSLAGTWIQTLSLSEIAEELEGNLGLLETTAPDVPNRQRSFVAVFHSSWQQLSPQQQLILAQLTVFKSFSKDWAKIVTGADLGTLQTMILGQTH
jgi:serine/threonine protein kinase